MNIDEMQAGPEIDALIATEVMGWALEVDETMRHSLAEWWKRNDGKRYISRKVWSPSTNIAHAWEVVDKMTFAGFSPRIGNHGEGHWWVTVTFQSGSFHHTCMGNTAPLAICRAALKAVGVK